MTPPPAAAEASEADPNLELLAAMVYDLAERLGDATYGDGMTAQEPAADPTAAATSTAAPPLTRLLAVIRQASPALVDLCLLLRAVGARLTAATPDDLPGGRGDDTAVAASRAAGAGLTEAGDLLDRAYDRLVGVLHGPGLASRSGAGLSRPVNPLPGSVPVAGPRLPAAFGEDAGSCWASGGRHEPDPRTVRWTSGYHEIHINCRRCGRCGSIPLPRGQQLDWDSPPGNTARKVL